MSSSSKGERRATINLDVQANKPPVSPSVNTAALASHVSAPPQRLQFHAIRKCYGLEAPAIFLAWEDCSFYLDQSENDVAVEYKKFEDMLEAMKYICDAVTTVTASCEPPASQTGNEKKSDEASVVETLAASTVGPDPIPVPVACPGLVRNPTRLDNIAEVAQGGDEEEVLAPEPKRQRLPQSAETNTEPEGSVAWSKAAAWTERKKRYFDEKLDLLRKYKSKYGTSDIPPRHETVLQGEFAGLDHFVVEMRRNLQLYKQYREHSPYTKDQLCRLLDIGFVLKPTRWVQEKKLAKNRAKFDRFFELLLQFKREYQTCDIPKNHPAVQEGDYKRLPVWVVITRQQIKAFRASEPSILDGDQVQRLLEIGFVMNPASERRAEARLERLDSNWDEMVQEWRVFYQQQRQNQQQKVTGESSQMILPEQKTPLRLWVENMRMEYGRMKEGKETVLTPARLAELTREGFEFTARKRHNFDDRAFEWLEFRTKHGRDPRRESEEHSLAQWVTKIRSKYEAFRAGKKTNLTKEQIDRLTGWGFTWEGPLKKPVKRAARLSWAQRLEQLIQYKQDHGDCLVPQNYPELGAWVKRQRKEYQKFVQNKSGCHLTQQQLDQLRSIGFVFEVRRAGFKRRRLDEDVGHDVRAAPVAGAGATVAAFDNKNESSDVYSEDEEEVEGEPGCLRQRTTNQAAFAKRLNHHFQRLDHDDGRRNVTRDSQMHTHTHSNNA